MAATRARPLDAKRQADPLADRLGVFGTPAGVMNLRGVVHHQQIVRRHAVTTGVIQVQANAEPGANANEAEGELGM